MNKHPAALPYLFLTEMWERYGFYVVQGLLVLYMTHARGLSDDESYTVTGMFTALAYISPILGGMIADRLLGFKTSITWGGLFLSAGYALLALPWPQTFYPALATIIVGNGLFKPNISTLLGKLYTSDEGSRDAGFTIFYVGINLGALLASLSSGPIKDHFGWQAGFGLASAGLLTGLAIFFIGLHKTQFHATSDISARIRYAFLQNKLFLLISCFVVIFLISKALNNHLLGTWLLPVVGLLLLAGNFILAFKQETIMQHNRLLVLNVMIIAAIVYWMLFLQLFFAANLFIDRVVDKQVAGFNISTTWFYGLESVFVVLLGPIFAWSWQSLDQTNVSRSPIPKAILGVLFAGLGFGVLALSTLFLNHSGQVNPAWIVLSYLLITIGELFISPIGLSAVTQLAPRHLTGLMMGIWFAALGLGGQFAGMLAKLASVPENISSVALQLPYYRYAFCWFMFAGVAAALALFILQKITRRALSEV
ncbi:MAG: peptide MFS transporter [Gammaproteobacteria bacterium]|nr:peptide MFS transporter [Gammaproteobacteria bacterium]